MLALMPLLEEAGVPAGVVNVIPSRRSGPVVCAMLHDPRVRVVSFTGSTEVGRKLLHEAADHVLKPAMELGGNAPFIVFEDADIDAAIEGAMIAKMRNMGASAASRRVAIDATTFNHGHEHRPRRRVSSRLNLDLSENRLHLRRESDSTCVSGPDRLWRLPVSRRINRRRARGVLRRAQRHSPNRTCR